jgi:hypothetical protein
MQPSAPQGEVGFHRSRTRRTSSIAGSLIPDFVLKDKREGRFISACPRVSVQPRVLQPQVRNARVGTGSTLLGLLVDCNSCIGIGAEPLEMAHFRYGAENLDTTLAVTGH